MDGKRKQKRWHYSYICAGNFGLIGFYFETLYNFTSLQKYFSTLLLLYISTKNGNFSATFNY